MACGVDVKNIEDFLVSQCEGRLEANIVESHVKVNLFDISGLKNS